MSNMEELRQQIHFRPHGKRNKKSRTWTPANRVRDTETTTANRVHWGSSVSGNRRGNGRRGLGFLFGSQWGRDEADGFQAF